MSLTLKESMLLAEARRKDLTYVENQVKKQLDRVSVELAGHESAALSKLARPFKRLDQAIKKMTIKKKEIGDQMKNAIEDLFDATDVVLTRVVETASFVITLSKAARTDPTKKTDYEKVAADLAKLIPAELEEKVKEIYDAYTEAIPASEKTPTMRVDVKVAEGVIRDKAKEIVKKAMIAIKKLRKSVASWALTFDKRLAALKARI